MSSVYICHTLYHVFISILKIFKLFGCDDIVLVDTIPQAEDLANRLRSEHLFKKVYLLKKSRLFVDASSYHVNHLYVALFNRRLDRQLDFLRSYEKVFIFNDYSELGAYLNQSGIPYHLIEDGCDCYKFTNQHEARRKAKTAKRVLEKVFGVPSGLASGKCLLDVEVNDAKDMRTEFECPIIEVPRKRLMMVSNQSQVQTLFRIFDANNLSSIDSDSILILTQPLWESGVTKRGADTAKYYAEVMRMFSNSHCYIKPHPRDDTDYSLIASEDQIIDKNLPIEILNYLGVGRLAAAVTYSSTAISQLDACRIKLAIDPAVVSGDVHHLDSAALFGDSNSQPDG